ncbi:MAG: hypothetical protein NC311_06620 [Muribaculaceae bacterium]|nr:hypothetical protein [Muribaculaceae bacterium]
MMSSSHVDDLSVSMYHKEMTVAMADILTRFSEAVATDPVAVAAVCPPAGVTVELALGRLRKTVSSVDDTVFIVYNPTKTEDPAYLALHKLGATKMDWSLAVDCMGKEYASAGYLCYVVPEPNYQQQRIDKLKAPVYNHVKYTTGFDKT